MEMHLLVYVSYSNGFSVQFALDYDGSLTIGWGVFLVQTKNENNGSCGLVLEFFLKIMLEILIPLNVDYWKFYFLLFYYHI